VQDFEGQRLAEMLTTVLLGAAGVCCAPLAYIHHYCCAHHDRLSPSSSVTWHRTSDCRSTSASSAPPSLSSSSSRRGRSTTRTQKAGYQQATRHKPSISTSMGRKWVRLSEKTGGELGRFTHGTGSIFLHDQNVNVHLTTKCNCAAMPPLVVPS
jgi:hypothetical protein